MDDCTSIAVNAISIILSGLASLLISRHYYKKVNRDMILRIIKPVVVAYTEDEEYL